MRPLALAAVATLVFAAPVPAAEKFFPQGQWGNLGIDVPDGWQAAGQGDDAPGGQAIRLTPKSGVPVIVLITAMPAMGSDEEIDRGIEKTVNDSRNRMRAVAVEKEIAIKDLSGPGMRGKYASATDRTVEKPTPDDFKYIDQGMIAIGRLVASFTVFSNADAPERAQAIEIVRSTRYLLAGPPWRTPDGGIALAYPGKTWKLALDLPGFDIRGPELSHPGGGVLLTAWNPVTEVLVEVSLEEAEPGKSAADYRERAWERLIPMDRRNVVRSQRGEMALLGDQRGVNAYLVLDGVGVEVHLAKAGGKPEDRKLFDDVLASVRIVE